VRKEREPRLGSVEPSRLSRRGLLVGGAATVLVTSFASSAAVLLAGCGDDDPTAEPGSGGGSSPESSTTGSSSSTAPTATGPAASTGVIQPQACVLSPELTAGPYYLDGHLARSDITEGRPGTPLEFRVRVLARPDCAPLVGAAVDIWHCDAGGEYSGFNGNSLEATQAGGTNDQRFLRGVQLTDTDGIATFRTIFPGWYEGRAVHVHLKVLDGGTLTSSYAGGHVAHVGQAFFDEALTAEVLRAGAYLAHTGTRTTNEEDSIYAQAGPSAIAAMRPRRSRNPKAGHLGEFTCIVDPAATPPPAPLF
jgi:protocatechuate 3,4-dioxygenase beta subunit